MIFLKNPGYEKIGQNLATLLATPPAAPATRPIQKNYSAAGKDDKWKWESYEELRRLKRIPDFSAY